MNIYKNETIIFNGITFKVIDEQKLDFTNAKMGFKSAKTKVVCAKGGEIIETKNNEGKIECISKAEKGSAIFCNNDADRYIPRNSNGQCYKFNEIEKHGYDIVESKDDYIIIQSNNKALLLFDLIKEPSCIKDAWGEGQHQFLYEGAVIKKDCKNAKITGIDKVAFKNTWTILN